MVDEPARMNETMNFLNDLLSNGLGDDTDLDEALSNKLEELSDIVEQIDMAIVFNKFGGTGCLIRLLESSQSIFTHQIKALAAAVIGTVAQNNIKVQDDMLQKGVIQKLVDLFGNFDNLTVCNKVINNSICSSAHYNNSSICSRYFMRCLALSVIMQAQKMFSSSSLQLQSLIKHCEAAILHYYLVLCSCLPP